MDFTSGGDDDLLWGILGNSNTPLPQHTVGGSRKIVHQNKSPAFSGMPGEKKVTLPTHPDPNDPARIQATAFALLDPVNDRTHTSSP